jgi:hypothetical protein
LQTLNKQSLTIDIRKRSISSTFVEKSSMNHPIPQFVQGDTNIIEAVIQDSGDNADLSLVGKVVGNFKRQDNVVVSRSAVVSGNVVTYTLGNEEMIKAGIGELELQFFNTDESERLSTLRFKVNVTPEIGFGLEGTDGPTLAQELIVNGQYAVEQGNIAKQSAEEAIAAKESSITTWLPPVADYTAVEAIASPQLGYTVQTNDSGYVYRYDGTQWVNTQQYGATALANVNAQLAETVQKFSYVSINEFPRLALETEDAARINRAIDSITEGVIQLYNGTYETKAPIKLKTNVTLQGQNHWKTIIQNTGGTNIIETVDTTVRYYYLQVNDLTLDGITKGTQVGLNIPHVSYAGFRNLVIRNCKTGVYSIAELADGTVTGAYYNNFYNPTISRCTNGMMFDEIANENTIFGGKIYLCDNAVIIYSNSVKYYGTAFEANNVYHVKLYGFNNSFFGVRMEGYATCKGVYNNPTENIYPNYFYSPHFQTLATEIEDLTDTLMILHEKGWNIPVRTDATSIRSKKKSAGSMPMVDMQQMDTTAGNPIVYKSKLSRATGKHLEGVNASDASVFEINYYGEFECKTPNRGIIVKSPNGTRWTLRVSDSGVASWVSLGT